MGVSKNNGTPKSSILVGFFIINHPFWGFSPFFWKQPYPVKREGIIYHHITPIRIPKDFRIVWVPLTIRGSHVLGGPG